MKFLHQNLQVKSTKLYSILYIQTGRMRIEFFYSLPRGLQSHLESKDNTPKDMHQKLDAYCGKKNTKANLFHPTGSKISENGLQSLHTEEKRHLDAHCRGKETGKETRVHVLLKPHGRSPHEMVKKSMSDPNDCSCM